MRLKTRRDHQHHLPGDLLWQGPMLTKVPRTSQNRVTSWGPSIQHISLWQTSHIQTPLVAREPLVLERPVYPLHIGCSFLGLWTKECMLRTGCPPLLAASPCQTECFRISIAKIIPEWFCGRHRQSKLFSIVFSSSHYPFVWWVRAHSLAHLNRKHPWFKFVFPFML